MTDTPSSATRQEVPEPTEMPTGDTFIERFFERILRESECKLGEEVYDIDRLG